jgi:hypothetical protein
MPQLVIEIGVVIEMNEDCEHYCSASKGLAESRERVLA